MQIKANVPNHDNSNWYKIMAQKAMVWNAFGKTVGIDFFGGYDHFQCEFSGKQRLNDGLILISGHRKYVNIPNPAATDRFSEVLKIEFAFDQTSLNRVKTRRANWFKKLFHQEKSSDFQLTVQGRVITFSSADLKKKWQKQGCSS